MGRGKNKIKINPTSLQGKVVYTAKTRCATERSDWAMVTRAAVCIIKLLVCSSLYCVQSIQPGIFAGDQIAQGQPPTTVITKRYEHTIRYLLWWVCNILFPAWKLWPHNNKKSAIMPSPRRAIPTERTPYSIQALPYRVFWVFKSTGGRNELVVVEDNKTLGIPSAWSLPFFQTGRHSDCEAFNTRDKSDDKSSTTRTTTTVVPSLPAEKLLHAASYSTHSRRQG